MKNNENSADLIIVGGGILGTFHAYHAIERGLSVLLLEKNSKPKGATVRNFGQVVPSGMDLVWQQFGRESLEIYKSIQQQFDISVREEGSIYLASDEDELMLIEELSAINANADYESEIWTANQCRDRYAQLRNDYCLGGLYFPQEISVNPRKLVHRLHQFLKERSKFDVQFQTCVSNVVVDDSDHVQVTTSDGRVLQASKVIVCSGSEFQLLFPERFRTSDLVAVKLQMMRLSTQSQASIPGNLLTGLSIRRYESFAQCPSWNDVKSREPDESFVKKWGVHILFKQETDGSIIVGDSHEYAAAKDIDHLDFELNTKINNFMLDEAAKILKLPSWDIENSWAGIYCQTNDPSGIYTQTIDEHIHIVTGIGGKGMTSSAGFSKHHLGEIYND